jgi:carbonic anhydrase
MDKILGGVRSFQDEVLPNLTTFFKGLARGQHPRAVFITCSDSRIAPHLITQTEPGDIFVIRNAGNIIPPYGDGGGEAASIEFAVTRLGVRHIIVCGHSHCGAMQALLDRESPGDASVISRWLDHAEAARDMARSTKAHKQHADPMTELAQHNVLLQVRHLHTHPCVNAALARNEIELHAWFYKLESGEITGYDEQIERFVRIIS